MSLQTARMATRMLRAFMISPASSARWLSGRGGTSIDRLRQDASRRMPTDARVVVIAVRSAMQSASGHNLLRSWRSGQCSISEEEN